MNLASSGSSRRSICYEKRMTDDFTGLQRLHGLRHQAHCNVPPYTLFKQMIIPGVVLALSVHGKRRLFALVS